MDLFSTITRYYKKVINGIAFIPAVISIGLLLMAIGLNAFEQTVIGEDILTSLNFIQVGEASTAKALLAALLTGTISLAVFSFSMVMVVVNQSASNYSPKVIQGLIGRTENQVILGIYIGTILFITASLTQVGNQDDFSEVPHFNVFTSILLMIASIGLFILFIENISNSVRITNVVERIFIKTKASLKESSDANNIDHQPDTEDWQVYNTGRSGYFQSIASDRLLKLLRKDGLKLKVLPFYASYLVEKNPLFCLNKKISDEELLNKIRGCFILYSGENVRENYFYGFRQLREVAVKGLSPGINDPGIAIICLDYLSELLGLYVDHEKHTKFSDEEGDACIYFKRHDFAGILNLTLTPIKAYGKKDYLVLAHLLRALGNISLYDQDKEHRQILEDHMEDVLKTAGENIRSEQEKTYINNEMEHLKHEGFNLSTIR